MFFDELAPVFKEFTQQPVAFFGGFFSGVLRLNLADDPVKSWLDEQVGSTSNSTVARNSENGNNQGPQSISTD